MELASPWFQARKKTTKALAGMISPAVLATPTGRSSGRAIAAVHKSVCDPSRRLLWCSKIKHFSRPAIEARNHADIGQCIQKLMAGAPPTPPQFAKRLAGSVEQTSRPGGQAAWAPPPPTPGTRDYSPPST